MQLILDTQMISSSRLVCNLLTSVLIVERKQCSQTNVGNCDVKKDGVSD